MIVCYSSGLELIACESTKEHILISDYFDEGGRDKDEYDRYTFPNGIVSLGSRLSRPEE